MTSWRAIPVGVLLLCGGAAGAVPLEEGESGAERARRALASQASVDVSTAAPEGVAPGLFSRPWAVCSDRAERLRDIRPGPSGSGPQELARAGAAVVFSADDGVSGRELWATSDAGRQTARVKDLRSGAAGSQPRNLTRVGDKVFFVADDGVHGAELWRTDGTAEGTALVRDVRRGPVGAAPEFLTEVDGALYFTADDGVAGRELWRSDGTEKGTERVRAFLPGAGALSLGPLTAWGRGVALVSSSVAETVLWWVDARGQPRQVFSRQGAGVIFGLTAAGRHLFFLLDPGTERAELWVAHQGRLTAERVWTFPGDYPAHLTALDDALYFLAGASDWYGNPGDAIHGGELWRSDGSPEGTGLVLDLRPGPEGSMPKDLVALDGELYFTADDGVHGRELWRSNGTAQGTLLVRDLEPGPVGSSPLALTAESGWLFFSAETAGHGREVWYSAGRPWVTSRLLDIAPGTASSNPAGFVRAGFNIFFSASDGARDLEVYAVPFRPWWLCFAKDC
ncbi:ELWxxDGT repeat protein [Corallococcus macrosporus]|uniref:Putative lipoprotein n=1 Tax=Myxococcus fulvus (strain ATCC BAA-855 / HW-1) TaxID=483219 RepID=F8CCA3_MYXFH|nr:ELWxxDGT repeat protein [Corallococcus macrosporus]AEI68437.1 putative lipoprotein [Corallococcus macrosporus]